MLMNPRFQTWPNSKLNIDDIDIKPNLNKPAIASHMAMAAGQQPICSSICDSSVLTILNKPLI